MFGFTLWIWKIIILFTNHMGLLLLCGHLKYGWCLHFKQIYRKPQKVSCCLRLKKVFAVLRQQTFDTMFWSPCNPLRFFDVYQYTRDYVALTEIVSGSPSQMLRVGSGTKRMIKVKSMACFSIFASTPCLGWFHTLKRLLWTVKALAVNWLRNLSTSISLPVKFFPGDPHPADQCLPWALQSKPRVCREPTWQQWCQHPTSSCVQPGRLLHSQHLVPVSCVAGTPAVSRAGFFSTLLLLLYLEGRCVVFKEARDCLCIKDLLLAALALFKVTTTISFMICNTNLYREMELETY